MGNARELDHLALWWRECWILAYTGTDGVGAVVASISRDRSRSGLHKGAADGDGASTVGIGLDRYTRRLILCSIRPGSSGGQACLIIQMIPRDRSGSVWTDEARNVSSLDCSGADQIDAEHQATDLAVWGFESLVGDLTSGATPVWLL